MQSRLHSIFHCLALAAACCGIGADAIAEGPVKVEVHRTAEGYQLRRGGQPYYVQGAVYWTKPDNSACPLSGVVARGGNSIRVGGDHLDKLVEAADQLGLTVTIGLPLQSQRLGFDYDDEAAVERQFEAMKAIVLRHKDNPATLIWGVGNELSHGNEVSNTYSNLRVWNAVNDIAKLIHEVDPHHPAMTVIGTASLQRGDLKDIIERCPDIEIIIAYPVKPTGPYKTATEYFVDRLKAEG